ncbi:hypothetical protein BDN70DRAFT_924869 [Pholiota conissans]|uniref:Uncharacterized protein n=1 Tax=Pholiota conissans TaxID=109636 RepID=A0A9P5YRA0_9AGAR|nr:hypothetical protein BDN70DRAFT_924869 [Pholiota conissans]
MLTHLEQAVVDTVKSKQELTYKNVLSVYCTIPGVASDLADHDPAVYFHRSLDKYADADDRLDSPYAKYIRVIRAQYWGIVIDLTEMVLGTHCPFPCPCKCGVWDTGEGIRKQLGVIVDPEAAPKRTQNQSIKVVETNVQKVKTRAGRSKKRRPTRREKDMSNGIESAGPSRDIIKPKANIRVISY